MASRLSEHGLLDSKIKITFYRHRDKALSDYFTKEDNFVFCKNVKGLLKAMGVPQYKPGEWRLIIDSSKQSLKCVLLHNESTYADVLLVLGNFERELLDCTDGLAEAMLQ